ncbi:hypothetical protein BO85DRAFT_488964 [Aspergillus piperis CBS 112811]|uniref:Uncharacterized protein n=1 Tax=Aspergillus piperis CBS 112811 TaxID=1448313 RepID=A0A8G1R2X4_9EURO|nr:hypothetical protein BO85DRAFT_488964 [Aspergillus piperis CBS 112811]RAH56790.1 hypothetical protein BO85DRAFT_488964 [Aspergillus piperis CBS 112811]
MSATVYSEVTDIDGLIPTDTDIKYRNSSDVKRLIPWVFKHHDIAKANCTRFWPKEESKYRDFFYHFSCYRAELNELDPVQIPVFLRPGEKITLPRQNWETPGRAPQFLQSQGMMLKVLMQAIYDNLENLPENRSELYFPVSGLKKRYVIGGKRYASRPEGAVVVKSQGLSVPIVSYVGWLEGQTSQDFLAENLSIMLGQLAANVSIDHQDQEVFTLGLYGSSIYISRGLFTTTQMEQVHSKGCSENETFHLRFSRGYNLSLHKDWLEAMHALSRLLRYLMSGNAKIGAIRTHVPNSDTE